jgi:hypothetical protein
MKTLASVFSTGSRARDEIPVTLGGLPNFNTNHRTCGKNTVQGKLIRRLEGVIL